MCKGSVEFMKEEITMKPFINLADLEMENCGEGRYQHSYGVICEKIGAKKLGYNLTLIRPGNRANFFHNHHNTEEVFLVLSGTGTLRFGEAKYSIKEGDVIACPAGGSEVAHQIINTGRVDLKFFALSTKEHVDVAEFPDSDKVVVSVGDYGNKLFQGVYRVCDKVAYSDGENLEV